MSKETMSEAAHGEEAAHSNEATHASNSWLARAGKKMDRWMGHAVRFLATEGTIYGGVSVATAGAIGTIGAILSGGAILPLYPIAIAAAGGALAAVGVAAQSEIGMKHAPKGEKTAFEFAKFGQTIGNTVLTTMAAVGGPSYLPVATGMYLAGMGMGARAMAHRK